VVVAGESVTMAGVLVDESGIRERWLVVEQELDERGRRMWAAAEARSHGWGGIAAVVRATGISEATVRRGIAEVQSAERAPAGRVRRSSAGRKPILEVEPDLPSAVGRLGSLSPSAVAPVLPRSTEPRSGTSARTTTLPHDLTSRA
jgi:hypothetical protein